MMSLGVVKASVGATLLGCTLTLVGCADSAVTPAATVGEVVPTQVTELLSEAELRDMQTIADRTGRSLADVIAAVAWQDDFGELVDQVRIDHPDTFVSSRIAGDQQAVITLTQEAPDDVRGLTEAFEAQFGVSIQIETDGLMTEETMEAAVSNVHMAVYSHPEVLDAGSSFESATNQIVTTVQLSDTAAPGLLDELQAVADEQLSQTAGVPAGITAVVRQVPGPISFNDSDQP